MDYQVDFIINRSRNVNITQEYINHNVLVFNDYNTTLIGNNKQMMYDIFTNHKLPISPVYKDIDSLVYPVVAKKIDGYGGDVKLINSYNELISLDINNYVIQKYFKHTADIRIYIINNEIIAAIARRNNSDFRCNLSHNAVASLYQLNSLELELVYKILKFNKFDFVGIDLLLGEDNTLVFNEIEDVAGCRSLYSVSNIDIVDIFIKHISNKLASKNVKLVINNERYYNDDPNVKFFDIIANDQYVGYIDLRLYFDKSFFYWGNVGYEIFKKYQGNKYSYYACILVFKYAKNVYNIDELYITCNPENKASKYILKMLKGEYLGVFDVPINHELYEKGERKKCVYKYTMEKYDKL